MAFQGYCHGKSNTTDSRGGVGIGGACDDNGTIGIH